MLNDLSNHPQSEVLFKEHEHLLKAAFLRLPEEDRMILSEKHIESKSVADIARSRRKTEKAVENILYRAKKNFQCELAKISKEKIYFFTIIVMVLIILQCGCRR